MVGYTVSIYKMEYDKYDSNLPYERLKGFDKTKVYMEVYKRPANSFCN